MGACEALRNRCCPAELPVPWSAEDVVNPLIIEAEFELEFIISAQTAMP
jgi:hypothetical protein